MAMAIKGSTPGDEPRRRSAGDWLAVLLALANFSWGVYHYQFESLPAPLSPEKAGKVGFSEESAMVHAKSLSALGPRPVGSDALDIAVQYVFRAAEKVRRTAPGDVEVEVDLFQAKPGVNGIFKEKLLVYSDLKHVLMRISPKNKSRLLAAPDKEMDSILVSGHIDTVFSSEEADDSSNVATMLELARGISQQSTGFKNSVIFLFNTGEEEGLDGSHSFITQHPWSNTTRIAVNFDALGLGGKSSIFQTGGPGSNKMVQYFGTAAKYPTGSILSQDIFSSGVITTSTDFQTYKEIGGLSGLDFAFTDSTAVYHTKNDKLAYLKPGSLQHLGDNTLPFLLHASSSDDIPKLLEAEGEGERSVYFDILGRYMVVYSQHLASTLNNAVTLGALLIWIISLFLDGFPAIVSLGLSFLSVLLMWIGSLLLSALAAVLLPFCSTSPVPFVAKPWLALGLFGAPALVGALVGQHVGFLLLLNYLSSVPSKQVLPKSSPTIPSDDLIKWEAERWLFKAGFLQWLIVLIVGNFFKVGSAYLALFWLVSPALAYGLMDSTLSEMGSTPKQLKTGTLLTGLVVPVLVSAGPIINLSGILIGTLLKSDKVNGSSPLWLANVIVALFMAVIVCLMLVYLLSIAHLTDNKRAIVFALLGAFVLSLAAVGGGLFPAFTENAPRPVNVVHVVEARSDRFGRLENGGLSSYVSLFSNAPGELGKEVESLGGEGFVCGNDKTLDLVSLTVKYGCRSYSNVGNGWKESEVPSFDVESDLISEGHERITKVQVDTKISTRWVLAVNTDEVEDFLLETGDQSQILVPFGNKTHVDGWHTIQFAGGKGAPTKFRLTLRTSEESAYLSKQDGKRLKGDSDVLLKLRADVNRVSPKVDRVQKKLPSWCSYYGKDSFPQTLAFLNHLARF